MKKYYDQDEVPQKNNKFRMKMMAILPAAFTRKEQLRILANANPNLAFGKNEYGEVDEFRKKYALQRLFDDNKYSLFFQKLKKPFLRITIAAPIIVFVSLMIMLHGYMPIQSLLVSLLVGGIFFLLYYVAGRLSKSSKNMSLTEIVNSKVVLDDHYLEYSYSTLNPKHTENDLAANFVVKRMAYKDISYITYYDKTGYCEVRGKYKYIKYFNYRSGQENPIFEEEEMNGAIAIFDVYNNRDLFAEISERANVTPHYGVEKRKSAFAVSFWTTCFAAMSGVGIVTVIMIAALVIYLFL